MFVLSALTFLAANSSGSAAPRGRAPQAPRWGGTLNIPFAEDATTLDPAVCYDLVCWNTMRMMFDRLLDYKGPTNTLVPQAAASWPTSTDGGKTYTFHLRHDMKFWNGKPVTARDVVYSFDRIFDPKVQSPGLGFWAGVVGATAAEKSPSHQAAGIKALGPYTVQIRLTAPNRAFPYITAMPQASIIPYGIAKKRDIAHHPLGSGPFIFQSWMPAQSMIFVRNPHYWDAPKPYIGKVYFHLGVNEQVALLQLEKGKVQLLGDGIPNSQILTLTQDPKWKPYLVTRNLDSTYYMTLNVQMKPFTDVRVRHAVALALDRVFLLRLIHGQGEIANELIPPGVSGYKPLPPIPHDLALAKTLLAKAGYPDGFTTTLYSWNTDPWTRLDAAVVQQLALVGIKVKVEAVSENAFFGLTSTPMTVPMALTFWIADFPEASDFFNALFSCAAAIKGGQNASFYCNHSVDALVTRALAASSPSLATNLYTQASTELMNDWPFVPLFHTVATEIHGRDLMNFYAQPVWGWDIANYWLATGSPHPPTSEKRYADIAEVSLSHIGSASPFQPATRTR